MRCISRVFPVSLFALLLFSCSLLHAVPVAMPLLTSFMPDVHVIGKEAIVALPPAAYALGASVSTEHNGTVTLTTVDGKVCIYKPDVREATISGKTIALSHAPFLKQDTLYVSFYDLVRHLGGVSKLLGSKILVTMPGRATPVVFPFGFTDFSTKPFEDKVTELYALTADGTGLQRLTYSELPTEFPAFSPDRTQCVYKRDYNVCIRAVNAPEERILMTSTTAPDGSYDIYNSPRFSTDGTQICFSCDHFDRKGQRTHQAGMISLDGGTTLLYPNVETLDQLSNTPRLLLMTKMHPEGRGSMFWLSTEGGEKKSPVCRYYDLLITPDRRFVAFSQPGETDAAKPTMHLLNTESGKLLDLGIGVCPTISPDGTQLMFSRASQEKGFLEYQLVVCMLKGPQAGIQLLSDPDDNLNWEFEPGRFSPDGSRIIYAEDTETGYNLIEVKSTDLKVIRKTPLALWEKNTPQGKSFTGPYYTSNSDRIVYLYDGTVFSCKSGGADLKVLVRRGMRTFIPVPGNRQFLLLAAPFINGPPPNQQGGDKEDFFG